MRIGHGLFLATVCALAPGCFVDLDRDAAILRLVVESTHPMARAVRVSLDETEDVEPFSTTFALDNTEARQVLRPINAPPGLIALTAETLDASAAVLQRLDDNLRIFPGLNEVRLDFGEGSGGVPENERNQVIMAETTVTTATVGRLFVVSVPVAREDFETAIMRITEALDTAPTALALVSVDVVVQETGGTPSEFDDHWRPGGEITVRVTGGNVDLSLPPFVPQDEQANFTYERRFDVSDWLTAPSDTVVRIIGSPPIGGPDLPLIVSVRLNLGGSTS